MLWKTAAAKLVSLRPVKQISELVTRSPKADGEGTESLTPTKK